KLICSFLALVLLSGCNKKSSTQEPAATKTPAGTPAAPATTAPAAGTSAPEAANSSAGASAETTAKMAAADWALKTPDGGIEWLDLKYPKPVHATEVRVRESFGSGAVIKIEVYDEQGAAHAVWQGNDPTTDLNYLMVKFPKTAFTTDRVKVTLATNVVSGWNEIDAVQLVGTDQ